MTGDERDTECFRYGGDTGCIVEDLRNIAVICDMDIRDEPDRSCSHHVDVAESCPCGMEACEEGKVREAGVHAIDGGDDILAACLDYSTIIHL